MHIYTYIYIYTYRYIYIYTYTYTVYIYICVRILVITTANSGTTHLQNSCVMVGQEETKTTLVWKCPNSKNTFKWLG